MPRKPRNTRSKAGISKNEEEIRGYIEKVIFPRWGQENKNGFAILAIHLSGGNSAKNSETELGQDDNDSFEFGDPNRITAKGTMPHPREGDDVLFKGKWIQDPRYGRQFQFSQFEIILPTSQQGVVTYFSGGHFYGLGTAAAQKIIDALGENCLNLLAENPELAYDIPGLSQKQQTELAEKMVEHGALGDLIALICRHGIGPGTAGRIYAHYGARAVDIVKENPYQLIKDVDGIGFEKADSIGHMVGIKKDSKFRIEAAIRHVLEEAKHEGHVAARSARVTDATLKLLGDDSGVGIGDVVKAGRGLVEAGELVREFKDARDDGGKNIDLIYLPEMYEAETGLAKRILGMVGKIEGATDEIVIPLVNQLEASMGKNAEGAGIGNGFRLAPEQHQAVAKALQSMASVVTGGPGTGKSTITKLIVAGYQSLNPEGFVYLVAPTGRASKRLAEATGYPAATIHRTLKYNPEMGFEHNGFNPLLGPGLLIVDEASMMDVELAYSLVKAVPHDMQVVFIGDVAQLPSVGPGAVLRDIIISGALPVTKLKYVYRQEEGSTISLLADMIQRYDETKEMPNLRELEKMCQGRDFQFVEADSAEEAHMAIKALMMEKHRQGLGLMDFMVLTPLKNRGAASAEKLNDMLREIYNPPTPGVEEKKFGDRIFRDGDKSMKVKKNDYKKMLFNGDIGIARVGEGGRKVFFDMNGDGDGEPIELGNDDLANIELAYSFTVHKSQGGEAPFVSVVCIKSHFIMLQRNLIYTGFTRAKDKLVFVGSQKAFEIAVQNNKIERRYGLLKERLQGVI